MLNGSLGWLNVGLGLGCFVLQMRFHVDVEEKDFNESVNGMAKNVLCWLGYGWSRIKMFNAKWG